MAEDPVRKHAEKLLQEAWESRDVVERFELVKFHNAARSLVIPPVGSTDYYDKVVRYMEHPDRSWIREYDPWGLPSSSVKVYEVLPEGRKIATGGG